MENCREDKTTSKPSSEDKLHKHTIKLPTLQALSDLLDFTHLILEALLHPIEAVKAYLPRMFGLFGGGKTFNPIKDIPHLAGKEILVSGLESVRQLAAHKPSRIYLAARTPSEGQAAVAEVKKDIPSADVVFLPLDLSSFESIANAAKQFTTQSKRLDILVNNAGVMALPAGTTNEGYEIQFGTNHVRPALLTKLLMPTLLATVKQGADVRIINLTSEAHNFARNADVLLDRSKLDAQGTWLRYGYSKLANILFTKELAKHYPSITSVAVHPGVIKSDLWAPGQQSSSIMQYMMNASLVLTGQTVQEGARNQLWAATAKKDDVVTGTYYKPIGSASKGNGLAQNPKMATDLWNWTEKELEGKGY